MSSYAIDDGLWRVRAKRAPTLNVAKILRLISLLLPVWVFLIFLVPVLAEIIWPEAGLITRVFDGNTVANENARARHILWDESSYFKIKEQRITFIFPKRVLTQAEEVAVTGWAHRNGFPVFASDWVANGPLAVDP